MTEADAYSGRVKREGRECVCVMEVMLVCVSVSIGVVELVEEDGVLEKEMRESDGCVREEEEMLVESNERMDDEESVKREPVRECEANALAMLVGESGANVVSEIVSEESTEM